mmetsp:Transcript_14877/g.29871  ORF Transcript_14877/g.29871 Transcript_14877/m.29871 type:complete len:342 (-) Transcript_14877:872-1897(-)
MRCLQRFGARGCGLSHVSRVEGDLAGLPEIALVVHLCRRDLRRQVRHPWVARVKGENVLHGGAVGLVRVGDDDARLRRNTPVRKVQRVEEVLREHLLPVRRHREVGLEDVPLRVRLVAVKVIQFPTPRWGRRQRPVPVRLWGLGLVEDAVNPSRKQERVGLEDVVPALYTLEVALDAQFVVQRVGVLRHFVPVEIKGLHRKPRVRSLPFYPRAPVCVRRLVDERRLRVDRDLDDVRERDSGREVVKDLPLPLVTLHRNALQSAQRNIGFERRRARLMAPENVIAALGAIRTPKLLEAVSKRGMPVPVGRREWQPLESFRRDAVGILLERVCVRSDLTPEAC